MPRFTPRSLIMREGTAQRAATGAGELHRVPYLPARLAAQSITIGFDGRGILRVRDDEPGGKGAWPFDAPFHLILNLAIGGDWAGAKGIDDAALPQRVEVDPVRVWQGPRGERG